jgi:alpha-N-acetylglucosaminidase
MSESRPPARYGSADPDALDAWRLLRSSAYATWGETASMQEGEEFIEKLSDFKVYACTDSVFAATPSLTADQASAVGPHRLHARPEYLLGRRLRDAHRLHYDPAQVEAAWRLLLEAAPRLRDSDTYLHDLVDVTRQILDDRGRALAPHLAGADAQRRFLRLIDIQDRLLATRPEYLLGRRLRDARRWGADEAQRSAGTRGQAARHRMGRTGLGHSRRVRQPQLGGPDERLLPGTLEDLLRGRRDRLERLRSAVG